MSAPGGPALAPRGSTRVVAQNAAATPAPSLTVLLSPVPFLADVGASWSLLPSGVCFPEPSGQARFCEQMLILHHLVKHEHAEEMASLAL